MRILVAENSKRMQEALRYALDPYGKVTVTSSAEEAKKALEEQESFDVVLTDYHMRGGSGLELIDYVNHHHAELPVIVLTAYGTKELTIACLNRRVFQFLEKPIRYDELKEAVLKAATVRESSLTAKRVQNLGMLSNLILHEIGGAVQDLLNETREFDFAAVPEGEAAPVVSRLQQLRNGIHQTANTFRNLKFLVHRDPQHAADFESVDLSRLMENLRPWAERLAKDHNAAMEFTVDSQCLLHGLSGLIERAVKNVLINAVEAVASSETGGKVAVSLSREAEDIVLNISNNGPAISPEQKERIFDFAFTTHDQGPIPRGIGLYVVAQVMKGMDGSVTVESTDERTSFCLRFPSR